MNKKQHFEDPLLVSVVLVHHDGLFLTLVLTIRSDFRASLSRLVTSALLRFLANRL